MGRRSAQAGVSLIEVLVSLLVMAIGMLGAAALQLNALKYTDSSTLSSKASFIAYDMMDRIRANPNGAYGLASLSAAPTGSTISVQDLADFTTNIRAFAGTAGESSSIVISGTSSRIVTITINWDDTRAASAVSSAASAGSSNGAATTQSYTLVSRVAIDKVTP